MITKPNSSSDAIFDVKSVKRDGESHEFALVRQFLRARYHEEHHALLRDFLPHHLVWGLNSGTPFASVGLQNAGHSPLFLEQYLDQPIEQSLSAAVGQTVKRGQIVEVGNLAASGGFSRQLILALTKSFYEQGIEWVAFTATTRVGAGFQRLGISPVKLVNADPSRIARSSSEWGSYYQLQPAVYVGSVSQGVASLNASPVTAKALADMPVVSLPAELLSETPKALANGLTNLAVGVRHG
jgi:hypothetical protein